MGFGRGASGRPGGHDGGARMNRTNALIKEAPESFLALSAMQGHGLQNWEK